MRGLSSVSRTRARCVSRLACFRLITPSGSHPALIVSAFVLAALLACSRPTSTEEEPGTQAQDHPGMTLLTSDNFAERLAASQEDLVLINFWATWCDPCKEEFPDLVKVEKEYRGKEIEFWAVSCDSEDLLDTEVKRFLAKHSSTLKPFYLDLTEREDLMNAVWPDWQGTLPATFIFRKSGERLFEHVGELSYDEFKAAVEEALRKGTP